MLNKKLKESNSRHLEDLEELKRQLLEAKITITSLQSENSEYKQREEETISVMKRIYNL